jgi:hypothetical protein
MVKPFYLLFIVAILSSCNIQTPIDIDTSGHENKMVIYGFFCEDDSIGVYLYRVTAIEDTGYATVNNAVVSLYMNNQLVNILATNDSGYYYSNVFPTYGNIYTITADHETFGHVEATNYLPSPVKIDSVSFIKNGGTSTWGDNFSQITVAFTDPAGENNYYEILPYSTRNGYSFDNEIFFTYSMNDPVLMNSGCIDNAPYFAYFSDQIIDGQTYQMNIHIMDNLAMGKNGYHLYIKFMPVAYDMYQYHRKMVEHINNQGGNAYDFLMIGGGNPVSMYTNVEGGYGVFAGYCKSIIEIEVNP